MMVVKVIPAKLYECEIESRHNLEEEVDVQHH